jgi:membrane protein implicated in regulation of membrane protease activity
MTIKRWTKIGLRTLHLVSVAGVGGGVLFALEKDLWLHYWWLALVSGALMMLVDITANTMWVVQVRGVAIIVKLMLLILLGLHPGWDNLLLVTIIVISAVISHAPGKVRYYSLYHRRLMDSDQDLKG